MKPIVTTLMMALIALATSAAAWYFYPRMETQQEVVREQLLTEEQMFEPRDVRQVRIEQFDRDSNSPAEFAFRLDSGSWAIPDHANYPANNTERVAAAVNCLRDREILEVVSDNKNDHEEYGVLEMSELGNTGLGAGTVITFEGRSQQRLGKLIVGTSPEGKPNQRYVRLSGQPQIYIVEFDPSVMTTDFSDWVDGRLIRVGSDEIGLPELIKHIDVDLYYRDQDGERKSNYRARIRLTPDNRWVYDLWLPDEQKNVPEQATLVDQEVNRTTLGRFVQQLMQFQIRDVARKQESAALDLANPAESQPASHFNSLQSRGFFHEGFRKGQHDFDAAAGEITVAFRFGMETRIYLGSMVGLTVSGGGKISRYLMLTANVDPALVPEPQAPSATTDDASQQNADQATGEADDAEAQQRRYQEDVQRRRDLLDLAKRESSSFNQVHADWVYVIPDEAIGRLFPPVDAWKNPDN